MEELYAEQSEIPRVTGALVAHQRLRADGGPAWTSPSSVSRDGRDGAKESPYDRLLTTLRGLDPDMGPHVGKLQHIARELVSLGSEAGEVGDAVGIAWTSLLHIFRKNMDGSVSAEESRLLTASFGPCQRSLMSRAAAVVHSIRSLAGKEAYAAALAKGPRMRHLEASVRRPTQLGRDSHSRRSATGLQKPFSPPISIRPIGSKDLVDFGPMGPNQCLLMEHLVDTGVADSAAGLRAVAESQAPGPSGTGRRFQLDLAVLMEEVSGVFEDTEGLVRSLFEQLCSPASVDELQAELMDLFGFERFELVGQILQHRDKLVKEYKAAMGTGTESGFGSGGRVANGGASARLERLVGLPKPGKRGPPGAGQMITVQSEAEVRASKSLMKEWKKAQKVAAKGGLGEGVGRRELDVDELRLRELELLEAQQEPLFAKEAAALQLANPTVAYPHVYDASARRSAVASVLSSSKVLLPANAVRKVERNFEEITIPHPPRIDACFGLPQGRIPIAQLSPVAQLAFKGSKSLNQIQSIVKDAALETNENLLVCAPTGAGKTNVAMLTILRCITSHMTGTRIDRNDFKVIYIAPMKALAAEMTRNFGERLKGLGLQVRELTGDTTLSKQEIANSQMLVVTPEKWDVVTRKGTGDTELVAKVRLLIIDEVHLLHDDRGPVIETIVARTMRQIEHNQKPIRIVALSATLPNYVDVAEFLHVNPYKGLFFFDGRFRPVPLTQTFVGVKSLGGKPSNAAMDELAFERLLGFLRDEQQILVFVHARNATGKLGQVFKDMASNTGVKDLFLPAKVTETKDYAASAKAVGTARSGQVRELFAAGIGLHHAGLPRPDRTLTERLFAAGHIRVLCCTSTLAWGVNLPAHAVIIRGTQIYDAKTSSYVDLGILDVQQIFGRAGRPQFDASGHGTIITAHDKMSVYINKMLHTQPIESQFLNSLGDNLNAEVTLGTVTKVEEAVQWLESTYLYVRAKKNPLAYGLTIQRRVEDPDLHRFREEMVVAAARKLDLLEMIRYDERSGLFASTDTGRIASHFYIKAETIELLLHDDAKQLGPVMTDDDILALVAKASEFHQLKVRDEEMEELDQLAATSCRIPVKGGSENVHGKVNILLQTFLSRGQLYGFSLISDSNYILQNASRILRALFEISLRKAYSMTTGALLRMAKAVERQMWADGRDSPLWQLTKIGLLTWEEVNKVQDRKLSLERLRELEPKEIGLMLRVKGERVSSAARMVPELEISVTVRPLTSSVLRLDLAIRGAFEWNLRAHGGGTEAFFVWVENPDDTCIYHHEYFLLHRLHVQHDEPQQMSFAIPIKASALPSQYIVRWASERWVGSEGAVPVSFRHLILPHDRSPHTELLDLRPLSMAAFGDERIAALYPYAYLNAVQTQIFHCLFHSDASALVGAPTGSGKTLAAEMAIFRVFLTQPSKKVVYIAPLKALVRERIKDWKDRIEGRLGRKVVELTGDVTPDIAAIKRASLIVTTPEKWDGVSRSWQSRSYVTDVVLMVIDEIHLLGEDRGPVLEVVVARTRFMAASTGRAVRVVGLSTALANAKDLADWLGVPQAGLFNFRPSVRPVPTQVHISGYSGKHYCPRMATMNKPAYTAIKTHSPDKPVLIFVSSRRQTRLTALDLMALMAVDGGPGKPEGLWMDMADMGALSSRVRDETLKSALFHGIGLHHAGLHQSDRALVEELFVNRKIQILIATATLAWGVNFPAHLVIVKGTEVYDGKTRRYVDMPVTDVLQMVGRAGRPQFDDHGVACVFVQDTKKPFYRKFLYEPFPVESSLKGVLADHLSAEIVAGTISSKQEAMDYLTWTYLFRRVLKNPRYYGLGEEGADEESYAGREPSTADMAAFLTRLVDETLGELAGSGCVETEESGAVFPTTLSTVASFYYLRHRTMRLLGERLGPDQGLLDLLRVLADAAEYDELPVRHNEDETNRLLALRCPQPTQSQAWDDPHTKAHLLYQLHFSRLPPPIVDYDTDRKSVIDNSIRIIQAILDVAAEGGWLWTAVEAVGLEQCVYAGRWAWDPPLSALPHVTPQLARAFRGAGAELPAQAAARLASQPAFLRGLLGPSLRPEQVAQAEAALRALPLLDVAVSLEGAWEDRPGTSLLRLPRLSRPARGGAEERLGLHAELDYSLQVEVRRRNGAPAKEGAFTPGYAKRKDEGVVLILGDVASGALLALKRLPLGRSRGTSSARSSLSFSLSADWGEPSLALFVLPETCLGLDQQIPLPLALLPPSIVAHCNREVRLA